MRKLVTAIIICMLYLPNSGGISAKKPSGGDLQRVNLQAGVCKLDITPPLHIPLGGYARRTGPATGIRDSLNTAVIVLDDGKISAAIVTLDLIQVRYKEGQLICRAIEKETGIKEGNVIINASHTHGSPWLETDSCYSMEVAAKVASAVKMARENLQPVSIGYGEGEVAFNVCRRKKTGSGEYINALNPDGLTDHRVKVLRIDGIGTGGAPKAVLFHIACHPNVFRDRNTRVSADFPGEAKRFIEKNFGGSTTALYLQGCAGDIRANLPEEGKSPDEASFGRNGSEADMLWCGWSAGAEVVKTTVCLGVREQTKKRQLNNSIRSASGIVEVSAKENAGDALWPREQITNGKINVPVKVLCVGGICFVTLPGEPVIAYGLKIEKQLQGMGFNKVFVLGYADGDAGYIPTKKMFRQGAYEVTESALLPSCEKEIIEGAKRLAEGLII